MRKIKLMALLLAALMIVTAFAGCASVKQEDVDVLDERVSAIEDLLKGQQEILNEVAGKVGDNNNQEILDAIESVKGDLEEKIDAIDSRVEAVEKEEPAAGTTVTDAVKAKQAEALASIEIQKATFSKNADQYDETTYAAVTAAFGTAQAEVNTATTEAGVKAAMDKLAAALDTYKTYAMKLYDYYVALLGNVNEDAEDLVDEVLEFIEVVDEAYEDLDEAEKIEELQYLYSEGTTASKNVYIDVYTSVVNLCKIFTKTSGSFEIEYVNEKGKVVSGTFETLKGFKATAKALDKEIDNKVGDEILYKDLNATFEKALSDLQDKYEDYVKAATLIGGEKLVALVTKGDIIADAEAAIEALYEAADAYAELNGRKMNGMYYYDLLTDDPLTEAKNDGYNVPTVGLTFVDDDETIWYADYYEEEITAELEAWIAEYDLSEDNVKAIVGEAKYNSYLADAHKVALIAAAYETFLDEIVPVITDLNKLSAGSSDAVEEYKELKEAIETLAVLQEADPKNDNALLKSEIILSNAAFLEFVEESEILKVSDLAIKEMQNLNDEKAAAADKARFDKFAANFTGDSPKATANKLGNAFIELFVFVEDAKHIARADGFKYLDNYANVKDKTITLDDKDTDDTSDDVTSTLTAPELYYFFAKEYTAAEAEAKKINTVIEKLVELVEEKKIGSNEQFILLAGEYVKAAAYDFTSADDSFKIEDGKAYEWDKATEKWVESTKYVAANLYVAIDDVVDYEELTGSIKVDLQGQKDVLTIDYFNYAYPVFEDLIEVADFEAAQKVLEDRIVKLFADIDELDALVEKIGYVRGNAYIYEDVNGNGKYDKDDEKELASVEKFDFVNNYSVSLNDKAAIDAAVAIYDAWVSNGGNENLAIFTEIVNKDTDKVFGGVYNMKGFEDSGEVTVVLDTLRDLEKQVAKLVALANSFVNGLKIVDSVNSYNSIRVNENENTLDNTTELKGYAITKYDANTGSDAVSGLHGKWTFVYKNADSLATTSKTLTTTNTSYTNAVKFITEYDTPAAYTKYDMLKDMVTFYRDFYDANVEYTAASDNDYEEGEAVYYVCNGYAAYKAVDDAKASYDKYDLIAAKAMCLKALGNKSESADTTFKRQVLNAKTLAELDNVINNYNSVSGASVTIKADTVKDLVIYEFDCLNYEELV